MPQPPPLYEVPESSDDEGAARVSIRFAAEVYADLKRIADLWNAMDAANGVHRRKWLPARVVGRFVSVGLDTFWAQVGGRPESEADRDKFVAMAIERLQKTKKK